MDDQNLGIIDLFETIAETGHAPKSGCSLFGVGFEDAFERLRKRYIEEAFSRGRSSEKFVIGPYGVGKTHFLREFSEVAANEDVVVAEVALNKDIDATDKLITYQEVVRELRVPGSTAQGIRALLTGVIDRVKSQAEGESGEQLLRYWVDGITDPRFSWKLPAFGPAIQIGLRAYIENGGNDPLFLNVCRWLEGEVSNKDVARAVGTSPVSRNERSLHGGRALLSVYQFIRHAGFRGTVVGFDEAEQSMSTDRKSTARILSMLQSSINAMADLQGGSALVLYAVTPDIADKMMEFPALQQRLADPGPGRGFFDGETLAPIIDLGRKSNLEDSEAHLKSVANRLVDLLYETYGVQISVDITDTKQTVEDLTSQIYQTGLGSGVLRELTKSVCGLLANLYYDGDLKPISDRGLDAALDPEV